MEERPQSISDPEILTEAEKGLREELLRIQDDPTLSVREKKARIRRLGAGPAGPMASADLYGRT